jgi:LysR family cys regulon transcriptional activator
MYDFIQYFAPHLTPNVVKKAMSVVDRAQINRLFADSDLPQH